MLFMIIEHFADPDAVYARAKTHGRMLPDGVEYINSWVQPDRKRCFQLMNCSDRSKLDEWLACWQDLVNFEVVEVEASPLK